MAKAGYFLKVKDIDGECTDADHKAWIELLSYATGVTQNLHGSHSGHGGLTGGNASFQDISCVKYSDKAGPKLMLACASGQHLGDAELHWVRAAGAAAHTALIYKLTNVLVSSFQQGGSDGTGLPTESFALNFNKVELEYKEMDAKGASKGSVKVMYDLTANKGQ